MKNVFVFVPSFRGTISGLLFETSHRLMSAFMARGIAASIATYSWHDISEIRNMVLSVWYDTMPGSSHILFLEDDMGFAPELVMDMMEFDEPVVGAIYPKRTSPRIWCGSGIESPAFSQGFMQVDAVGGGCLLIRRDAVTKLLEKFPQQVGEYMVLDDMKASGAKRTLRFFDHIWTDEGKASEDTSFCWRWREAGGEVWASTAYEIQHVGPWIFSGCFAKEKNAENALKAPITEQEVESELRRSY